MFNVPSFFGFKAGLESFDPDAAAFFSRVTTAGGSLTLTEKQAVNTLVIQMKADGIWSKMKAIYPMVGGGNPNLAAAQAACEQNLLSSSFTGSFTSGWTFASTGVTPNGTSAYMDTGLNPSASLSSNLSTHMSYYSRTNSDGTFVDMGSETSPVRLAMHIKYLGIAYYDQNNQTNGRVSFTMTATNSTGLVIMSRTSSTVQKGYLNNVLKGTNTSTMTAGLPSRFVFIGAFNTATISYANRECALASIGDGLTDTEASDFYTAVQAFQTTLSRQV
jgi:hypothetical protein